MSSSLMSETYCKPNPSVLILILNILVVEKWDPINNGRRGTNNDSKPILLIFQGHTKLNVHTMPYGILNIRENERRGMQTQTC